MKDCPAKDVMCDKCKVKGHFSKACIKCTDCGEWGHKTKKSNRCSQDKPDKSTKKTKNETDAIQIMGMGAVNSTKKDRKVTNKKPISYHIFINGGR